MAVNCTVCAYKTGRLYSGNPSITVVSCYIINRTIADHTRGKSRSTIDGASVADVTAMPRRVAGSTGSFSWWCVLAEYEHAPFMFPTYVLDKRDIMVPLQPPPPNSVIIPSCGCVNASKTMSGIRLLNAQLHCSVARAILARRAILMNSHVSFLLAASPPPFRLPHFIVETLKLESREPFRLALTFFAQRRSYLCRDVHERFMSSRLYAPNAFARPLLKDDSTYAHDCSRHPLPGVLCICYSSNHTLYSTSPILGQTCVPGMHFRPLRYMGPDADHTPSS